MPQACAAIRWPAPTRRLGPRDHLRTQGPPSRRTAQRPRRQAANPDAPGTKTASEKTRHHFHLCDPRPRGSPHHERPRGRDQRRSRRADRDSERDLLQTRHALCRFLYRRFKYRRGRNPQLRLRHAAMPPARRPRIARPPTGIASHLKTPPLPPTRKNPPPPHRSRRHQFLPLPSRHGNFQRRYE